MKEKAMNQRRQAMFRIVLVLGIIILLNIIAVRLFTRIDLTQGKIFTLSDASKNLVKSLDDKFLVKAYFTSDLPAPYNNNKRDLQDKLDEYRAYARGNFQYEFIDPAKNQDIEQEAMRSGIQQVQVQVLKDDKLQVQKAYMGLVFLFSDKKEVVSVIQSTENLEYEISSAMKKMTSKEMKKVAFLSGHGEPNLQQMSKLQGSLSKQYEVSTVDLVGGKIIPDDISVLVIDAPTNPFKSWEKYLIDQYLMKGGKVAFLVNKVDVNLQNQRGRPLSLDLDDMLESYGIRVNTDLVRDISCAYVTVSQQAGFMVFQNQVPFYYLPRASEFDKTSPIVKDLSGIVFYFISSVDTSLARPKGLNPRVLVKTTSRSGRQENYFVLNPNQQFTQDMFKESGIPLVVTLDGTFSSTFQSKPIVLDSTVQATFDTTNRLITSKQTKIAVIGDGDFIQDQLSGGSKDNMIFASNLIDWLADDIGLAAIRSRESGDKPLDEVSEGTKIWIKGINLAMPPVLVIFIGIIRWRLRVGIRRRLEMRNM
jgi:gliding-associated putative ABC transporter substrate-binding component GldG